MDLLSIPDNIWLVGIFVVAVTGLWFVFDKPSSKGFLHRVRSTSRKASTAGTPPPSISPRRKSAEGPASPPNFADALPPQRRQFLANLGDKKVPSYAVDEKEVIAQILPMHMDFRSCTDQKYTPTGFSVQEIKELSDFPNYAELSGVPLPNPYDEFKIDSALPRPYRPFRWSYHQTMCMFAQLKWSKAF